MQTQSDVIQILGSLMKQPQLLSQTDRYSLSIKDFSTNFEKYIFDAIEGLYFNGAKVIQIIDVENAIENNTSAKRIYEQNKGHEYLEDALEFTEIENFGYYYNHLKKLNALKQLKAKGYDISPFYREKALDNESLKINEQFEKLTLEEIFDSITKELVKIRQNFTSDELSETKNIFDGLDDLLDEGATGADIGMPVQGQITTLVMSGARRGTFMLRSGGSGLGKALPNSTKIPTPDGWKQVGDIKEGDLLFDAFGKPTLVRQIFPQGKKDVWKVTFKDGREALCNDEHLWSYCKGSQKENSKSNRKFYTKTTKEIYETENLVNHKGGFNILVPQQYAVQYEEKYHYLPPYAMGLILGDGSFRYSEKQKGFSFSSADSELPEYIANCMNWKLKKNSDKNYSYSFGLLKPIRLNNGSLKKNVWVEDILNEYPALWNKKSEDKFIPRDYLEDSIENRIELLSGLLDTDGSVDTKGRIDYFTVSEQLRDDVIELCQGLGFKTHVITDTHKKGQLPLYIVHITGRPDDKVKLFKMQRKKQIIENWYNSSGRKEKNEFNPIIKIENLNYQEEMTCFLVDNEEHLFLMNNFIVTHNTRNFVADSAFLAFPFRFNPETRQWEQKGSCEKILYIVTEQSIKEIQRMVLAYITGINESKFRYGQFNEFEIQIIEQAVELLKEYQDNFIITQMPSPTNELVKNTIREQVILNDIGYVFFDYVFISPALINEFKGTALRNDELLLILTTTLKNLAQELDVFVMSGTQVNASADDNKNIRNEASLAGGRSQINKADYGFIMSRPTAEELGVLEPVTAKLGVVPNMVTDVFKVRSGEWTQVRIWQYFDYGILRRQDLFMTDSQLNIVNLEHAIMPDYEDWENEDRMERLGRLNCDIVKYQQA